MLQRDREVLPSFVHNISSREFMIFFAILSSHQKFESIFSELNAGDSFDQMVAADDMMMLSDIGSDDSIPSVPLKISYLEYLHASANNNKNKTQKILDFYDFSSSACRASENFVIDPSRFEKT